MKVGLFGGSFNPIHNGHIKTTEYIINKKLVDEVWILPCKIHAFNKQLASPKERVSMIEMALEDMENAKICNIELKSKDTNYTVDTVRKLKKMYNHEFLFIIGYDILKEIHRWYKHKQLFKEVEFIAFKRNGYDFKQVPDMKIAYMIKQENNNVSSTLIRNRVQEGKSLKNLIPLPIQDYITKRGLYR